MCEGLLSTVWWWNMLAHHNKIKTEEMKKQTATVTIITCKRHHQVKPARISASFKIKKKEPHRGDGVMCLLLENLCEAAKAGRQAAQ